MLRFGGKKKATRIFAFSFRSETAFREMKRNFVRKSFYSFLVLRASLSSFQEVSSFEAVKGRKEKGVGYRTSTVSKHSFSRRTHCTVRSFCYYEYEYKYCPVGACRQKRKRTSLFIFAGIECSYCKVFDQHCQLALSLMMHVHFPLHVVIKSTWTTALYNTVRQTTVVDQLVLQIIEGLRFRQESHGLVRLGRISTCSTGSLLNQSKYCRLGFLKAPDGSADRYFAQEPIGF